MAMQSSTQNPSIPKAFVVLLVAVMAVPFTAAIVCTMMQRYPATYAIQMVSNGDGTYNMKAAILLNFIFFMIPVIALVFMAAIIKKLFVKKKEG